MKQIRYHTMNSWKQSESYACNLEITCLGFNYVIADNLFDLIDTQELFCAPNMLVTSA